MDIGQVGAKLGPGWGFVAMGVIDVVRRRQDWKRQPDGERLEESAQSRFSSANCRRLSAPGLRTFLTIADLWGLNEAQRLLLLGCPPRSTFQNWSKIVREHGEITLGVDVLVRISLVLGIHQALGVLQGTEQEAVVWLRTPHAATVFGGQTPLDLMTSGMQDGLVTVRRFLDAARGGLYMDPIEALDKDFRLYTDGDLVVS
jgi:hypothetical protein